ncbi:MAG: hypothetical protein IJP02_07410 [Oscillospiraceae bacterium]|nr:hypothetical protein [Oscillospiraceae bacterium]
MMDQKKRMLVRFASVLLAGVCLLAGVALAAGEGTKEDPLITLSYLEQTAIPAVLEQVDERVAGYEQQLVDKLDEAIRGYSARMEEAVKQHQSQNNNATYAVVTLTKGQQLKMDVGCEVMLRIGTAQCVSPSNPGLINTTTGQNLNNGSALEVNHLYMATITDRAVKATANTTKVLVRGGYSIA